MHDNKQLNNRVLLSYGGLGIPLALTDVPIYLYLPVFYSREVGIDLAAVGLIFVFARLWDGVTDPLIGWLSDHTRSRFGRRKPWVVIGIPLLLLSIWHVFNPAPDVGPIYVVFWLFCLFLSWTAIYIPYLSWGAELSADYDGRSRVVAFREVGYMVGSVAVSAGPVFLLAENAPVRDVLYYLLVATFLLFPLTAIPLSISVPDRIHTITSNLSISKAINVLLTNKPFQRLVLTLVLFNLALGMLNSLAIFLVDEGLGLPGKFFSFFLIEYLVAIALSPLLLHLAKQWGKHRVLVIGLVFFGMSLLSLIFGPRENYLFAASAAGVLGVGFAAMFITPSAILADIIDYDTVACGEKRAGIYMAVFKFASKASMAFSVGIAYGLLDLFGYNPKGGNGEFGIYVIKLVGAGIPVLLIIPGMLLMMRFPIDRHVHASLREQLEQSPQKVQQ